MFQCCRLCNGSSFDELYSYRECNVVRCRSCGFVQVIEKFSSNEIYSEEYFSHGKLLGPADRMEQKRRMRWVFRCGLKPGMRLLDAGCATGEFLSIANKFYEVNGIDISTFAIEHALKQYPFLNGRLRAGPLEQVDFDSFFFDAIVMWDVIEHLKDPRQSIIRLLKLLKPGGLLCVSTPNIGAWTAKIMERRWAFMTPPEHQSFFDSKTLTRLMNECSLYKIGEMNRGKWVNLRFLLYKIQRVFPGLVTEAIVQTMIRMIPRQVIVYAPTGDVLYAGFRLR